MIGLRACWLALAAAVGACAPADPPSQTTKLGIVVTLPPVAYLVERVGGDEVSVRVLLKPGQSYHALELTPRQVAGAGESTAYFHLGVAFERPLVKKLSGSFPHIRLVNVAAGVEFLHGDGCHADHDHSHTVDGSDPHIWLDPARLRQMVEGVAQGLSALRPSRGDVFRRRAMELAAELEALDAEIAEDLAAYRGRKFIVYHPSFGYFAARYGLRQVALEQGGREPGPRQLVELLKVCKEAGARTLIAQPQNPARSVHALAESLGAEVALVDPLAYDVPATLRRTAQAVRRACGAHG